MRVSPFNAGQLTGLLGLAFTLVLAGAAVAVLFSLWHATWLERLVMLLLVVPLLRSN